MDLHDFKHDFFKFGGSLRIYNPLVQRCFSDCVNNFGPKSLGKHEELCVFMTELNKLVNELYDIFKFKQ
ncbi:Mitochondrial import inner membrane translocase subunit TIM9 [Carex littledalei]|uniref:Mitochondrial import inner membrane translocase subunit n=1 Tax=Carex littledalei TaxID=544730 RepID=A0A833VM83_9POAL|nr:Mitochondrial import inner membrane translocase subunit TIM9 [Carex littledalei]